MGNNLTENRVSVVLSTAEQAALTKAHTDYVAVLEPKTVTLTKEQEDALKGIDVDNLVFVDDVITATDSEGLAMLPAAVSAMFSELLKDLAFFKILDAEEKWLLARQEKIRMTKRVVANECMTISNVIYKQYRDQGEAGVPGAQAKYEQLKSRYEKAGRPSSIKNL